MRASSGAVHVDDTRAGGGTRRSVATSGGREKDWRNHKWGEDVKFTRKGDR